MQRQVMGFISSAVVLAGGLLLAPSDMASATWLPLAVDAELEKDNAEAALFAQGQQRTPVAGQVASAEEIVAEINRLRTSPAAYAVWLETLRPYYDGAAFRMPGERGVRTVEGVAALESAIAMLASQPSVPAITLAPGLVLSTQGHLAELLDNNRFTLAGLDESTPLARAQRYGELEGGRLNELLNEGFSSAEAIVAALVIDDGNASRRTRRALLDGEVSKLAAACGVGPGDQPLCVVDYATGYTSHSDDQTERVADVVVDEPIAARQLAVSATDSVWFGTPSAEQLRTLEQALIEETNRLRANPAGYGELLLGLREYYEGSLVKVPGQPVVEVVEGVAALDEAIAVLQNTDALSTLAPSVGMAFGARDHAQDLGTKGLTGHYGSDNSDPFERISRYGRWDGGAGENISYGQAMLAQWHITQLLIDDNVPSRGHREALLRPNYQRIGAACSAHPEFRIVCVMTYASDYQEGR